MDKKKEDAAKAYLEVGCSMTREGDSGNLRLRKGMSQEFKGSKSDNFVLGKNEIFAKKILNLQEMVPKYKGLTCPNIPHRSGPPETRLDVLHAVPDPKSDEGRASPVQLWCKYKH